MLPQVGFSLIESFKYVRKIFGSYSFTVIRHFNNAFLLFFVFPHHQEYLVPRTAMLDGVCQQVVDNHPDLFAGVIHDNFIRAAVEEVGYFFCFGKIHKTAV
ncbi:hypothetical protein SDC9_161153 [bioreactor metagenome]|uniref:Uncharacterized protein n=1 Tax=bioreactor metagenome TaxID=1076179 RepID=A0A645FHK4_9ZZZZ